MQPTPNLNAALLSLLWPGAGQLAQGRLVIGAMFVTWSALSAIGLAVAPRRWSSWVNSCWSPSGRSSTRTAADRSLG